MTWRHLRLSYRCHHASASQRPSPKKARGDGTSTSKLTPYETERETRIETNKSRLEELRVVEAAKKVGVGKKVSGGQAPSSSSSRKRSAAAADAAAAVPERRSSRPRKDVSYKEPTMKDFEEEAAAATTTATAAAADKASSSAASRSGYNPPEPKLTFTPSLNLTEGARDKRTGALVFPDFPEFRPNLTPKQVIRAGSWGGVYFHPRGGKPGIRHPKDGVKIDHKEFPEDWFEVWPPSRHRETSRCEAKRDD